MAEASHKFNDPRSSIDDVKNRTGSRREPIINAAEGLVNRFLFAMDGREADALRNDVIRHNIEKAALREMKCAGPKGLVCRNDVGHSRSIGRTMTE